MALAAVLNSVEVVLKVELHSHTADDPQDRIPYTSEQLVDRAAALGYGALAITLHDKQLDLARLTPHAAQRGITLIPGIERTVAGKHILLLNFRQGAEAVRNFDDIRRLKASDPRGLVIAPHPYFPGLSCLWGLLDDHEDLFDAVEVNGMFTEAVDFNAPARRWAQARGKPLVGNGDVHRLVQLGPTYSLVDAAPDADAICAAVKAGRVEVHAQPHAWLTVVRVMGEMLAASLLPAAPRAQSPEPRAV